MAKSVIKGRNAALYVQKSDGSTAYTRVLCASSVSLEVTTESVETDCVDTGAFGSFEPDGITWTASCDMTVRQVSDNNTATPAETDATDNVVAENLLDYQLAGRKFMLRFDLGVGVGSARYGGLVFITKNGFAGPRKGNATNNVAFQGAGPLTKTLAPS